MYLDIFLPDYVEIRKVSDLIEIDIKDWKESHPGLNAEFLKNTEDPTKAKLICQLDTDSTIEELKKSLKYNGYLKEHLQYIDVI